MVEALAIRPGVENSPHFDNSRSQFARRLYDALGLDPNDLGNSFLSIFPPETFESLEDILAKSEKLSKQIAENWQDPNTSNPYKPSPNDLLQGLTDFAVFATQALHQTLPEVPRVDIEVAMIVIGTRIRSSVIDSEDRRRNTRTERDIFTNLYRGKLSTMWAREESNL